MTLFSNNNSIVNITIGIWLIGTPIIKAPKLIYNEPVKVLPWLNTDVKVNLVLSLQHDQVFLPIAKRATVVRNTSSEFATDHSNKVNTAHP